MYVCMYVCMYVSVCLLHMCVSYLIINIIFIKPKDLIVIVDSKLIS